MKRIIALLAAVCIVVCLFTGCDRLMEFLKQAQNETKPSQKLTYELTPEMVDNFYTLLAETEALSIEGKDLAAAEEKTEQLDDAYLGLIDQYQIAYVNYCLDQSDQEQKQIYMDCVEMTTDAETAYNDMCKRVYQSGTPIRDQLFADWTQEEIDMMLRRNEEIAQLQKRNEEITLEYRDLAEDGDWEENMVALYNEMVGNNNRMAEIYGYENYYVFAYQMVYQRDYDMAEILKMRQYVARYIPAAFTGAMNSFYDCVDSLGYIEQSTVVDLLEASYDEMDENYVEQYILSAPKAAREGMQDMFDGDRVIFADNSNSYEGAFTTWIGGKPYCYYGPGYDNSMTMIHELGHYYGCSFVEPWDQPMDLSETQSQGNEWLFLRSIKPNVSEGVYNTLVDYKMMSEMGNFVCFSMIDEFEQRVYASEKAGNMTVEEYEALMAEIAEPYGGIDYICENMMDIQLYWKYVVLESPVYYISYAVSGVAAVNLYTVAQKDLDRAFEIYIRLIEEPQEGEGFLGNIQYAGLTGPFEETVYKQLYDRYAD